MVSYTQVILSAGPEPDEGRLNPADSYMIINNALEGSETVVLICLTRRKVLKSFDTHLRLSSSKSLS